MLPARGNYADLAANVAALLDGEICYAIDQDQYYQKEGSVLVSVGATKAQGLLAESALQDAPSDGSEYVRKDGSWAVATGGGGGVAGVSSIIAGSGISVDSATGDVTITATGGGGGSGATQLNELTDVDLSTPATTGDVLLYDGSQFTAFAADQIPNSVGAQPRTTFTLAANGTTSYLFSGPGFTAPTPNPALTLVRGQTYVFSNTTGLHPFEIQDMNGDPYNSGVTNNNTIGDVIFVVPFDAPELMQYQCTAHSNMIGPIVLLDAAVNQTPPPLGALFDVDTDSVPPQDGEALVWDDDNQTWVPGEVSGGGASTLGELGDVDMVTTPAVSGDALVYDGANWVPGAGSGGSSEPSYIENTIPQSQIIAAHTFQEATPNAASESVNMASWNGTQGNVGYGSAARRFWDFEGSSAEAGYTVDWPVEADTQGIIIQFDLRWDGSTTNNTTFPILFSIGDDTTNDGTSGGFSIRISDYGSGQYAPNVDQGLYYSDAFVYLSDDTIADDTSRYVVGTKPFKYGFDYSDGWTIDDAADRDALSRVANGEFNQIVFVIHTDENGVQDGRFSCYVNGELMDYNDRRTADEDGNIGPIKTGGAGYDKLFIGAPRGATYDESYQLDNVYVAYGQSAEPGAKGIEFIENKTYGAQNYDTYPTNPILTDRTFRSLIDVDTYIGSLKDVSDGPALGHGQVLGWNPTYNQYENMDGMVVRGVVYSGYGTYPYASSDMLFLSQRTGNVLINAENGRMAVYTGPVDYDSGNGGWMEWNINPLFPA